MNFFSYIPPSKLVFTTVSNISHIGNYVDHLCACVWVKLEIKFYQMQLIFRLILHIEMIDVLLIITCII